MENFDNKITPAEYERLALLIEEAGEVLQVAGKIMRHGFDSYNPYDPELKYNRELLEVEMGDLLLVMYLMMGNKDVDELAIFKRIATKSNKINNWLHHNTVPEINVDNYN